MDTERWSAWVVEVGGFIYETSERIVRRVNDLVDERRGMTFHFATTITSQQAAMTGLKKAGFTPLVKFKSLNTGRIITIWGRWMGNSSSRKHRHLYYLLNQTVYCCGLVFRPRGNSAVFTRRNDLNLKGTGRILLAKGPAGRKVWFQGPVTWQAKQALSTPQKRKGERKTK